MRIALALAVVLVSAALGACSSCNNGCNDCAPKTRCCPTWQPDCCNTWDFYVPCDMIEGREYRRGAPCGQVPTCAPCE
jgi:hypothetical protein